MKGLSPEEQIEAALRKGLSRDRSDVNSKPVYRKLDENTSQPRYDEMWNLWEVYVHNNTKFGSGVINANIY